MKKIISNIRQNRYLVQIITLISGTLLAQVISFISIPILTRLYNPDEFGLYSIFFAITSVVGIVSSLNYEQAVMLPKSNRDAKAILVLSILSSIIIFFLSIFIIIIFNSQIESYFLDQKYIVYLIPISILVIGLNQIFDLYATREELYKKIALSKITTSSLSSISQISIKSLFKLDGLIFGKIVGDLAGTILLIKTLKDGGLNFRDLVKDDIFINMKRYSDFPKYQMPSNFINSISQNTPLFMLSILFSPAVAGFFSLTYRAMLTPSLLISGATRSVFYQKASKMYSEGKDIFPIYFNTTLGLIKIFAIPFIVIAIFGEEIFGFVFGDSWREAGVIAQIAIIWFYFGFISSPTNMVMNILNIQKMRLYIQSITLILRVIAIYLGYALFNSYIVSIILFVIVGVFQSIFTIIYVYFKLIENRK
jgi:O-antigen/teichoic acid export membrane protein